MIPLSEYETPPPVWGRGPAGDPGRHGRRDTARYDAMEDQDEQEACRTAVREFVRMYAFLVQTVGTRR
jgi:hypothetical protein